MSFNSKAAWLFLLVYGLALTPLSAQQSIGNAKREGSPARPATEGASHRQSLLAHRPLDASDGLSVIAAALDLRGQLGSKPDCSHLVHGIYERAGFPYSYAGSADIYNGIGGFLRVKHPQPGDLVVWPGHVGIVVNPARDFFFSSLNSGLGIDSYAAPYWKERGRPRFYRYVKSASLNPMQPTEIGR